VTLRTVSGNPMSKGPEMDSVIEPHPSPAEQLAAEHPDWEIYRELRAGRHGDWIARHLHEDRQIRATAIEGLAELLAGET
jgi:hypothetical protein